MPFSELQKIFDHINSFDCGNEVLNEWLRRRALHNQREGPSRTWVITDGVRVAAFYASSTAAVARTETTRRAARNQPDPIPAMLLGRLAVDRAHQNNGLAAALLKHFLLKTLEVAELTGVRLDLQTIIRMRSPTKELMQWVRPY